MGQVKRCFVEKVLNKYITPMEDKNVFPTILEEIDLAHREWKYAIQAFDYASKDSIDYAVYRLNASERKYIFLLNEAKNKGINACILVNDSEEKQIEYQ